MTSVLLTSAEAYCDDHGLRFTDTRRLVLGIIAGSDKPITAYEILAQLAPHIKNPKPPIVYRSTDFWQTYGFVHKIESLNAFVVCGEGHQHRGSQFMICDGCGDVSEIHLCHLPPAITALEGVKDFTLSYWNLEMHGRCAECS